MGDRAGSGLEKKWWHSIIGYQIYPRSFQDTDGDGNGDLQGIILHLDDLKELGVNALWLCPVTKSPMLDSGYDVADYDEIDPMFGTMEDMKRLIDEAKKRGIHVIMDLVVNHTSSEHPWFLQALKEPEGKYGKYYVIRRGHDGQPPNGWQSFFGGSAWEPVGDSGYYYLHLFTKYQPDLNWENPRLRQEIYDMINRWLDKGIDGFRIDSINHLKKDFSASREAEGTDSFSSFTNVEGIGAFLGEMRDRTYGPRDAFTIGEVNGIRPEQMEEYIGENGYFSTMFDFTCMRYRIQSPFWRGNQAGMVNACRKELFDSQALAAGRALFCNVMENHDTPRLAGRFCTPEQIGFYSKSALGAINFFLAGIPFLYQGQAIGMEDFPKQEIGQFRDFATFNLYQEYQNQGMTEKEALEKLNAESREHARTPMQWSDEKNAGFTDAEPWFDINPGFHKINLAAQKKDAGSLYAFYKRMIALRRRADLEELFIYGETVPVYEEQDGVIAYERRMGDEKVLVLCNISGSAVTLTLTEKISKVLLDNYHTGQKTLPEMAVRMEPFQVLVLR